MLIELNDKAIEIPDPSWKKHCQIHPVRSDEVLFHNIQVTGAATAADIIDMIEQEYEMSVNMPAIVKKARDMYADS